METGHQTSSLSGDCSRKLLKKNIVGDELRLAKTRLAWLSSLRGQRLWSDERLSCTRVCPRHIKHVGCPAVVLKA